MFPPKKLAHALTSLLVLLCLAPLASAQGWAEDSDTDVRGRVIYTWPGTLNQGYFPFWVELENRGDQDRTIHLEATSGGRSGGREVTQSLTLAPGQKQTVELFAPAFTILQGWSNSYRASFRVGNGFAKGMGWVAESQHNDGCTFVLFVSDTKPQPGQVDKWSGQILNGAPGLPWTKHSFSGSLEVEGGHALFDRLPSQYAGYTSLDAVVVDAVNGLPSDESMLPLLEYARAGGRVVFLGDDVQEELAEFEQVAGWLEDRFKHENEEHGHSYSYGMGALYFGTTGSELMQTAGQVYLVRRALSPPHADLQRDTIPSAGKRNSSRAIMEIPGLDELPLKSFAGVLLIFALIIGPANFWFLKKTKRPALLLLTIPGISIAASVLLLAYGIFQQGIDVKMASKTLTLLDQRARRSTTLEERALYIGLSTPPLRPEPGTLVMPVRGEDSIFYYRMDFRGGLALSGAFNPVRTPVEQVLVSERVRRVRLGVTKDAQGVEVVNTLPMGIERLLVRDDEGKWHRHLDGIDPEGRVRLEAIEDSTAETELNQLHRRYSMLSDRSLVTSSYIAIVDSGELRDTCGLELNEMAGSHIVVGILPLRAEDWE
jgi:hypothetical protein